MEHEQKVEKTLSDLMVGATVLSMKVAGPELEIFFTGGRLADAHLFSIDTDAWVFVYDGSSSLRNPYQAEDFFLKREESIVRLFRLTGYDVAAVSVFNSGMLEVAIEGRKVVIVPERNEESSNSDSWDVVVHGEGGKRGYVSFEQDQGFRIRTTTQT